MTVELEEGVELARLTTIGTGGPALWSSELAYPENAGQYPIAV